MSVLVSIHDVAPPFERQVRELWAMCFAFGVKPALLVVPSWHGGAPLEAHPRFVDWIFARADQGARIFLHGERHDEVGQRRRARDWVRAVGRTNAEGEFLSLDRGAARERIARGAAVLRRCGLAPIGFIPPAWLARAELRQAVRDEGLQLTEDSRFIWRVRDETPFAAPAVRWSARSTVRAHASAAVASARWRLQREAPLVRLALHPTDLDHPATRESLAESLHRWLEHRAAICYTSFLSGAPDPTLRENVA